MRRAAARAAQDSGRNRNSTSPYSTGWPLVTGISTTSASSSDSISFISFIASTMHSTWPCLTLSPTSTNGGASGPGDR